MPPSLSKAGASPSCPLESTSFHTSRTPRKKESRQLLPRNEPPSVDSLQSLGQNGDYGRQKQHAGRTTTMSKPLSSSSPAKKRNLNATPGGFSALAEESETKQKQKLPLKSPPTPPLPPRRRQHFEEPPPAQKRRRTNEKQKEARPRTSAVAKELFSERSSTSGPKFIQIQNPCLQEQDDEPLIHKQQKPERKQRSPLLLSSSSPVPMTEENLFPGLSPTRKNEEEPELVIQRKQPPRRARCTSNNKHKWTEVVVPAQLLFDEIQRCKRDSSSSSLAIIDSACAKQLDEWQRGVARRVARQNQRVLDNIDAVTQEKLAKLHVHKTRDELVILKTEIRRVERKIQRLAALSEEKAKVYHNKRIASRFLDAIDKLRNNN